MQQILRPFRVARRLVRAYDPRFEVGRLAWRSLDADGLEELRAMAKLSRFARWMFYDAPDMAITLFPVLAMAFLAASILLSSYVALGLAFVFLYLGTAGVEQYQDRVSVTVDYLKNLLEPLERHVHLCEQVRGLVLGHEVVEQYRDEVVQRRALVFADLKVMEALVALQKGRADQQKALRLKEQSKQDRQRIVDQAMGRLRF